MGNLFTNYYELAAMLLFVIGFLTLLIQRNLIKKIIGMNIMDTSVFLFLAAKGYVAGRMSPIIRDGVTDASLYINPIPAGLVLTGIVVAVSTTAFALALALRWYQQYNSLDVDWTALKYLLKGEK
ncbi:MAG: cation:proton antiporter subunit C [Lachnospiraceae bacterium]|nr:cation:proton antiporter subunit C [Lachnospiraceae bacterium]